MFGLMRVKTHEAEMAELRWKNDMLLEEASVLSDLLDGALEKLSRLRTSRAKSNANLLKGRKGRR